VTRAGDGQSQQNGKGRVAFPDLVIAGPGWDSGYGEEVRRLIDEVNRSIALTEHRTLNTEHSACVHAVDMLSGAAKWGALYGCEAFVLPSHQENFGIAVVEALACGKPVLISDQVNIWREIVEDGAGLVEGDTEEGVEKLLRRFLDSMRHEADDGASHGLTRIDTDKSEQPAADRAMGNAASPVTRTGGALSAEYLNVQRCLKAISGHSVYSSTLNSTMGHRARACYLKRFAIGPAAVKLAEMLGAADENHDV
jgi:hypothetical protein